MTRTILSATIGFALLASMAPAAQEAPPPESDLAGMYSCEGTNPNGTPYTALVEIVRLDKTYLVKWIQPNGTEVLGVGLQRGSVLSVSYFGSAPAIVVYSVGTDGKMDGKWTMGEAGQVFSETLTKLKAVVTPRAPRPRPTRRPNPSNTVVI